MRPGAVVQARTGSTRLPDKVLADLAGRPLLWHVITRLRRARHLAFIGVATTTQSADDRIVAWCEEYDVPCHRGSVDDVLGRLVGAARAWQLDPVVRITADCPFVDPDVVDALVDAHVRAPADYTTYGSPTLHEGIDPFSLRWLERQHAQDLPPDEREHPLLILRRRPAEAQVRRVEPPQGAAPRPGLRLSVDEEADLVFARAVCAALGADAAFSTGDLLDLLDARPDLVAVNAHVGRVVPRGIA